MENNKSIGIVGLGKMGLNIALHLKDEGINVIGFNRSPEGRDKAKSQGLDTASSVSELIEKVRNNRAIIWIMVPAGAPVDEVLFGSDENISKYLKEGDIVIDGGNSYYKDTLARYKKLEERGIHYMDCGTSGGMSGARNGACLMIGGKKSIFEEIEWVFSSIAQKEGYFYVGPSGSGNYVKMIHNAIEYGMMQAIAEGIDLIKNGAYPDVDMEGLLHVWNNGSIIESYLTSVLEKQLREYPNLDEVEGVVEDNGEGAWTIGEAIERKVPALAVSHTLFERYASRRSNTIANKMLALMRNGFGGHKMVLKK